MAKTGQQTEVQGSLFEEDFLRRTLGDVVRVPHVALGELVANAWDAGAAKVNVTIPAERNEVLSVEDDGSGLDEPLFRQRWMTLAYDRCKHQGTTAEFPPERAGWNRRAYGRNGQGRHGLLCFGDSYHVETWRDGTAYVFEVTTTTGTDPFVEKLLRKFDKAGHGTKVSVAVTQHRPDAGRIRDLLSTRFLHEPRFIIEVNGESVSIDEHPNLLKSLDLQVTESVKLRISCVEGEPRRTKHQSGVAFWVGGRLVGEPGWVVGGTAVHDGRTRSGRRLTFLVRPHDLHEEVVPDWTGFRQSDLMSEVYAVVIEAVQGVLREVLTGRVNETRGEVMDLSRDHFAGLTVADQVEVAEVIEIVTDQNPLMDVATVSAAVQGVVQAKQRRSTEALFQRLLMLPPEDIDGLHRLLDEWTMRDALTVLDEIGRRIKVVEALEKLEGDRAADELHTLHPLVTQARWLFGPEYESATFASNVTIRSAVLEVFREDLRPEAFQNHRKRPDLLFRPESTVSAVATENVDPDTNLAPLRTVLLIELKKGRCEIGRSEVDQAGGYIEDLLHCGLLDGPPRIFSFVVGHTVADKLTRVRKVGDPEVGRIEAVTYQQLVRTANARLFRLRDVVQERYPEGGHALLAHLTERPEQMELLGIVRPPADDSDGDEPDSTEGRDDAERAGEQDDPTPPAPDAPQKPDATPIDGDDQPTATGDE